MRELDIALCLHVMFPPGLYSGSVARNTEEEFNRIIWQDEQNPKPTWQELNNYWKNNQESFHEFYV